MQHYIIIILYYIIIILHISLLKSYLYLQDNETHSALETTNTSAL